MDHGSIDKGEGVAAGGDGVAFVDQVNHLGIGAVELADHIQDLAIADNGGLGVADHQIAQGGGMVGLHVVDKDVVQLPVAQGVFQVLKELSLDCPVYRVEQDGLFVQQQVGVEGHPTGNRMGALKQRVLAVIAADPNEIFRNVAGAVHIEKPSFR